MDPHLRVSGRARYGQSARLGRGRDTNGGMFSLIYRPWLNTSFRAQYTVYGRFDGRVRDYDGTRDAWNNDALSLLAWVTY